MRDPAAFQAGGAGNRTVAPENEAAERFASSLAEVELLGGVRFELLCAESSRDEHRLRILRATQYWLIGLPAAEAAALRPDTGDRRRTRQSSHGPCT